MKFKDLKAGMVFQTGPGVSAKKGVYLGLFFIKEKLRTKTLCQQIEITKGDSSWYGIRELDEKEWTRKYEWADEADSWQLQDAVKLLFGEWHK
jgi:hypothetical protein